MKIALALVALLALSACTTETIYISALLSCDGPQPMMLEETTNVAAPAH